MSFISISAAHAEILHLTNANIISGAIREENSESIILDSELLGQLTIKKIFISRIDSEVKPTIEEPAATDIEWVRNLEASYGITKGNTETADFASQLFINRKTDHDETTMKATVGNGSSDKKMNSQTWYTMARYAYSFGKEMKWFNPYKIEVDHDKFANIDYRIIPSTGLGFWLSDTETFKAMAEGSLGLEHTEYNNGNASSDELVAIPHVYAEYTIKNGMTFSEDIFAYPSLSNMGDYRVSSTTALTCPIMDTASVKFSWVKDYDSEPEGDAKELDHTITTAIVYNF